MYYVARESAAVDEDLSSSKQGGKSSGGLGSSSEEKEEIDYEIDDLQDDDDARVEGPLDLAAQIDLNEQLAPSETTSCPICFEDFDIEAGIEQVDVPPCGHEFCRACLQQHCQHSISVKSVPIPCPRSADKEGCEAQIPHEIVRDVLLGEQDIQENQTSRADDSSKSKVALWQKFQALGRKGPDSRLYDCPSCEGLVFVPDPSCNDVTCTICKTDFCLEHGGMHSGVTCSAFRNTRQARAIRKSERTLDQYTKPCSHCGCRIQKAAGCDYVVCGHCHRDMCWKCGTHEYMTGHNIVRTCHQCKMKHQYANERNRFRCFFLYWPLLVLLAIPLTIIYVVVATVISVVTCCCGGCFGCGRCILVDAIDDDGLITRQPGKTRHGICVSLFCIFLPFSLPLQDAGLLNYRTVEEVLPRETREIPFMVPTKEMATEEEGTGSTEHS